MKIESPIIIPEEVNKNIENETKDKNILSITFFLITVLVTLGLLSYNYFMDNNITSVQKEINITEQSIAEINTNKDISIYKLISSNRKALNDLETKSNITSFIEHLNNIKQWYNIDLRGFNYQNGELKTFVIINNGTEALSYNIAKDFIKKYRIDENSKFNLGFISSITGNDKITFNISLNLKK